MNNKQNELRKMVKIAVKHRRCIALAPAHPHAQPCHHVRCIQRLRNEWME